MAMARESRRAKKERAGRIYEILEAVYPDAHCALVHQDPFQLLAATILSAQCTDERVNMVTPELFARFPHAGALAGAEQGEVEEIIRSTGFFRSKAKNLIGMADSVVERHGGEIPRDMEALVDLPGVGRKTANVVLGNAFGINEGVVVDTHVKRLAGRMGLTSHKTPEKIEPDLMRLFERERWTMLPHLLIFHGRQVCKARKPACNECALAHLCPASTVP
mgnify:CR=1 FL=1